MKKDKGNIDKILKSVMKEFKEVHSLCNFKPCVYLEAFTAWDETNELAFSKAGKVSGTTFKNTCVINMPSTKALTHQIREFDLYHPDAPTQ